MKLSIKSSVINLLLLSVSSFLFAASPWNMTQGVTDISKEVFDLHMKIFYVCVAIGVVTYGALIWALIFYRKSQHPVPAKFHENIYLEIAWTTIPFLILISMALPATKVLLKMSDTSQSEITVKVVGYQWFWGYEYINEGISFVSNLSTPQDQILNKAAKSEHYLLEVDQPLVLPINKKVRFLMTAADVQHSFWVPDLGYKKDCIPGFINEAWTKINEPGLYRGKCAELCGFKHGYMPIVVKAVTWEEYLKWVEETKISSPA